MNKSHGHEISLATRPQMSTTIQDILETWQNELRRLLDKTSSRITSQEHTKRITHANHCYRNATNRTTTTTKGSARSMKIRCYIIGCTLVFCCHWYWLPSLVLTTVIGTDYPLPASLTRQWLSEIIAKFDIPGRNTNSYIRIYELARTPNIEYGEHGITLQW